MKPFLRLSTAALAILLQACTTVTSGTAGLRFLKEEPYRKVKQRVDLSSVKNERDMAVVGDAIDTIMRLVVSMSFTKTTLDGERSDDRARQIGAEHAARQERVQPLFDVFDK